MHKVFINDNVLIFENIYKDLSGAYENFSVVSNSQLSLSDVIKKIEKNEEAGIVYLCNNPDQVWFDFTSRYVLMEAGGGVVKNDDDELLIIYRKKKWDLPKGKLDYGETPEAAAIREVKEECGINELSIEKFLMKTFHTYSEKNKMMLKKTHWYRMNTPDRGELVPELKEGIEEARWMNKEKIYKKVFAKTYNSIKEVLATYYEQ